MASSALPSPSPRDPGEAVDRFDAVVVGSGATGGVAAMVLAEAGLSVLVLEAGEAISARRARGGEPGDTLRRLAHLSGGSHRQQAQHPGYWKHNPDLYIDERAHPWTTPADAPFLWTRGRQLGGRSLTWGGITLRLSEHEFRSPDPESGRPSWPIGSADLAPYYSRLEQLLGVHGQADGLAQLPDGDTLPPLPFTPGEEHLRQAIGQTLNLPLIHSRGFRLHRPRQDGPWPPSSSPGGTLARALATGRVQVRCQAVVSHLEVDPRHGRAEAVVLVDGRSGRRERLATPLVVLCASTVETLRILLHSCPGTGEGKLAEPSGRLGRHLMDHISCSRFFSLPDVPPPPEPAELSGAGSCFIPNTVNLGAETPGEGHRVKSGNRGDEAPGFRGGYGLWTAIQRFDPPRPLRRRPEEAVGFLIGHGEVQSDAANRVTLNGGLLDRHGLPTPHIELRWGANEAAMVAHMQARMQAVVTAAGGTIRPLEDLFVLPLLEPLLKGSAALAPGAAPAGYYIHELGGARLSASPEHGVLDPWNRCWGASNVLVSDGASWPSAGWQSPTLTSMALTWRACEAAVARMRRGEP